MVILHDWLTNLPPRGVAIDDDLPPGLVVLLAHLNTLPEWKRRAAFELFAWVKGHYLAAGKWPDKSNTRRFIQQVLDDYRQYEPQQNLRIRCAASILIDWLTAEAAKQSVNHGDS